MIVWTIDRIQWEQLTDKRTGEEKTVGILCRCVLCGPVERHQPLVRFDLSDEDPPYDYPRKGICGRCINRAQRAIDHRSAEAGMVRIGSPYQCSHCHERVTPVIWFSTNSIQEQYICARCLVEAQRQFLIDRDELAEQKQQLA